MELDDGVKAGRHFGSSTSAGARPSVGRASSKTLQDCEDAVSPFRQEGTEPNGKIVRITPSAKECISKLRSDFETKLSDDLHTPYILNATLQEAFRFVNTSINQLKKKQQKQQLSVVQSLVELETEVKQVLSILGLLSESTYSEVLQQLKDKALKRSGLSEQNILQLIEERMLARKSKDFKRGDEIRVELAAKGIALMDVGNETIWRPCVRPVQEEQPPLPSQEEQPSVADKQEEKVLPVST
ncbi:cysteinyl-tRNA synthetase, class Ia family protein [Actinidia rufa]|uniref:Cysteinyl-tRNA synthetase, class Ia family protein n=1 Tax=Actinidia rufa TaxID=165716 RepID=A0A7J0GZ04_9ERIC|nr:cysteinyl-tRNA synthetase, class Ia family protein [Actinidia rufa]